MILAFAIASILFGTFSFANENNTSINESEQLDAYEQNSSQSNDINELVVDVIRNPFVDMFGDSLYQWSDDKNEIHIRNTSDILSKTNIVGIYFSASWCAPCRQFTPILAKFYNEMNKKGKKFQIVWVSRDSNENDFVDYYHKMPWLAVPIERMQACAQLIGPKFKLSGIPHFVVLDGQDGSVYTLEGRSMVAKDPYGLEFPWQPRTLINMLPRSLKRAINKEIENFKFFITKTLKGILDSIAPKSKFNSESEFAELISNAINTTNHSSSGASASNCDDDDLENDNDDNHPMMSIFASYYGIEDPTENSIHKKDSIDDAKFDPEAHVKNLLLEESIEGLVGKDTEMMHEIRTLDGEMQKLVYDNYNKFINATETIKEMKNDVYGMDEDMESVRQKMNKISENCASLDNILQDKRNQIDKLVRVRRLLNRLEFLSELPEKLAAMIENKQYKEAVQLYHKTISVLTRHSHVLSFKNIKERTELMMQDLTGKVINMLDDDTLESDKITQYVYVLRLMNAPRLRVVEKLMAAHKRRSISLISLFKELYSSKMIRDSTQHDALFEISTARKFHQSLIVVLIEACKGIQELYQSSLENDHTSSENVDNFEKEHQASHAELKTMIQFVMSEYTKALIMAFKSFFTRFNQQFLETPINYDVDFSFHDIESSTINQNDNNSEDLPITRDSKSSFDNNSAEVEHQRVNEGIEPNQEDYANALKLSALIDERNSWIMLARQAVMDVLFLDSTEKSCGVKNQNQTSGKHHHHTNRKKSSNHNESTNHSNSFATILLNEFYEHNDLLIIHRIKSYLNSVVKTTPKFLLLCDIKKTFLMSLFIQKDLSKNNSGNNISNPTNLNTNYKRQSSLSSSIDSIDRLLLQKNIDKSKQMYDRVLANLWQMITDVCKDIRPIIEIHEVCAKPSESLLISVLSRIFYFLPYEIEQICGIKNNKFNYDMKSNTLQLHTSQSNLLLEEEGEEEEIIQELSEDDSSVNDEKYDNIATKILSDIGYKSIVPVTVENDHTKNDSHDLLLTDTNELNPSDPHVLLFAGLMKKFLPDMMKQMNNCMQDEELPTLDGNMEFKEMAINRVTITLQLLFKKFIEINAEFSSQYLSQSQYDIYIHYYDSHSSNEAPAKVAISNKVLQFAKYLDKMTVMGCIMLSESPPQLKMAPMERDIMRRTSVARGSIVGHNLHLDIERLFSQKIIVFDIISSKTTEEIIMNIILKAALKATQEVIRSVSVTPGAYIELQANITFVKQIAASLLRDFTQTDSLVEQILTTIFSRYTAANDISNASDVNE
eukprot:gene14371-19274_t